jgi:glutamate/tyrosine decarboxylase-like PLP-dependent enzyme
MEIRLGINMTQEKTTPTEETLDPQDWEAMRALGHRMLDDVLDYAQSVRQRPVWQHAPEQVKAHFSAPLPPEPQAPEDVYQEFLEYVFPYPVGNIHPRFWGWVFGTGTVLGTLAAMLTAAMNTNAGDFDHHSANHVERQVLDWCKEMLGYPATASGLLTSGCSAANLIGLTVARNAQAGFDLRREGLRTAPRKMTLYASQEIHSSVQKAVELLGLGSAALRRVPVNDRFQIDLGALQTAIAQDRQQGHAPFCVVGAAGTVNTGAFDDLQALANVCQAQKLWLHVDGAFGAWAALAPDAKHLVAGMERADSLAFDLHKWMYMPYEIGCVLLQNERAHREAFALRPAYLARSAGQRGLTGGDLPWLCDYGFQLSRGFRALKAWMSLKEHGSYKYARLIQQNINQARYLAELVQAAPELELAAPVPLNVVCFRYLRPGLDGAALDALNEQINVELQEQGIAVLSMTEIKGRRVLRVANTNHRTRREDFEILVREVLRIGQEL